MKMFSSLLARMIRWQDGEHSLEEDQIFDNIARRLANPMPRRKALKLVGAGVAGVALAEVGLKPAWAQMITCTCEGELYDPNVACCTRFGLRPKHPIMDLFDCPNRVPHPGH